MSPIRAENRHRYPAEWPAIRERILIRAHRRCERCGLPNYAVGYREQATGRFVPAAGNLTLDALGNGEGTYAEAHEAAEILREGEDGLGPGVYRVVVIVLTIAHLNHQPEDCRDENLQALCQQCHNRLDVADRSAGIRASRFARQPSLFAAVAS